MACYIKHLSQYNFKRQFFAASCLVFLPPQAMAERRVNTNEGNAKSQASVKVPHQLPIPAEWQNLIDPTKDEFWSEGNFTPDGGFLLWAKNPTVENAKLYLIRMNAKRDRLHVMQKQQEQANVELIKLGVIANDYDFLAQAVGSKPADLKLENDTQVFFLFKPECPHCQHQAQILALGSSSPQNIVPMQIGEGELYHFNGLPQSVWATKEDVGRYAKDKVVPVLLIYDRQTNNMAAVSGVRPIREIRKIADQLKKEKQNAR